MKWWLEILLVIVILLVPLTSAATSVGTEGMTEGKVVWVEPESKVATSTTIYSGNISHLTNLTDVNIGSPSDDEVLSYDAGTTKWIDKAISSVFSFVDSWLFWDGNDLGFNETRLNLTIGHFTSNITTAGDTRWVVDSLSIINVSGDLTVNGTWLNNTIGSFTSNLSADVDTRWVVDNLTIINFSGTLEVNGTWLNNTIGSFTSNLSTDIDTRWGIDNVSLINVSGNAEVNGTWLNNTIGSFTSNISEGNLSFNQTFADSRYVMVTGDNMTGDLDMGENEITGVTNLTISECIWNSQRSAKICFDNGVVRTWG